MVGVVELLALAGGGEGFESDRYVEQSDAELLLKFGFVLAMTSAGSKTRERLGGWQLSETQNPSLQRSPVPDSPAESA